MRSSNHEHEIKSMRFASALMAWQDFVSAVETHGANCIRYISESITLEVVSVIEPVKFDSLEEMKPVFLHEYERQLTERGL